MSSPPELSDLEDNLLSDNDADGLGAGGNASDEAIEDTNFREDDDDETDDSKKRRVDPKSSQKRTIRNPQPKLDAERLKGPKGIHTIEQHFSDFKFRGKGHEKTDLNRLMKKLEYWSHRLFPKFAFDDCLTKLETLGTKKPVQTHLTRIRLGMLTDDNVAPNDAEEENEEVVEDSEPIDEFDALIAEELEKKQSAVTPQRQNASFIPTVSSHTPTAIHDAPPQTPSRSSNFEITAEMRERMERNRQIAIQKRLARINAEKATKKDDENETPMDQDKNEQIQPEGSIATDPIGEK